MKLKENALRVLEENKALQEKAYDILIETIKEHGGEFRICSSISIDLDMGFVGVRSCNILGLYINKAGVIIAEVTDIDTAEESECDICVGDSVEVLQILQDATTNEEDTFLRAYPTGKEIIADGYLEAMWLLLSEVNINEDDEIEQDFLYWDKGANRESIWEWFDKKHSKGVAFLNGIA